MSFKGQRKRDAPPKKSGALVLLFVFGLASLWQPRATGAGSDSASAVYPFLSSTSTEVERGCEAEKGNLSAGASSASGHLFKEFTFDTPKSGPSIVMVDRENNVWVAMARAGKIGRMRDGKLREYNLPPQAFPVGITIDALGQVWYSDIRRNKIGRLDPQTGTVKDYAIPTPDSWPFFIVIDHQSKLWFTQRVGNNVARLDPQTGEIVEFRVPTAHSQPAGITVTPDGEIFFTENTGNKVGHLDPKAGKITEYEVPTPMTPSPFYGLAGIAADKQGTVWFAEVDGRLGLLRRGQTKIEEIPIPNASARPAGVIVDEWGIVWFTELDGNCISSYNPILGEFQRYQIPTGMPDARPMGPPEATARGEMPLPGFAARTSRPFGIAADTQGRIWFSEQYAHQLGVLTPPVAEVFHPRGLISAPRVPVKVQLRLTDKESVVSYMLDGKPLPRTESLDLARIPPGQHTFTVAVARQGDRAYQSSLSFSVNPTLETIRQLVTQASTRGEMGAELRQEFQESIRFAEQKIKQGETGAYREVIRGLISKVSKDERQLAPALTKLLLADLRYIDLFGKREYTIEMTDAPPYFSPRQLEIEVGDTVVWKYRSSNIEARNASHPFHTLATRGGDFTSPKIRPGASWSHTFSQEGAYKYLCVSHLEMNGAIITKPRTTHMLEFPMAGPDRVPGVLSVDDQDNIWFTAGGGGFLRLAAVPLNNKIGRMSPDGRITEYETPTLESGPTSIHVGKGGHVWFTERAGNKIGELDPANGKIKEYALPTPLSAATGITVNHDGKVWYAAKMSSKVGVLDPSTGQIEEYDTPTPKSQPSTITVDNEGNVWFDERASDKIVRLNPKTRQMREYSVPTPGSRVVGLVPDNRGHVWFLELGANKVGRLDAETEAIVEYAIPTRYSSPFKLTLDSLGRVWFTEVFGNKVGMLQEGKFYEFAIPTRDSMPGGIAIDSKGNIWFTQQAGNKLGMIPSGALYSDALLGGSFRDEVNIAQARRP